MSSQIPKLHFLHKDSAVSIEPIDIATTALTKDDLFPVVKENTEPFHNPDHAKASNLSDKVLQSPHRDALQASPLSNTYVKHGSKFS